jgi:urease accessory protein
MPLAVKRVPAAERPAAQVIDTLILNYAQRSSQRGFVFGVKGTCVEFDFAEPVHLRTDDVLLLDDGNIVEIVAEAEPLLEVRLADPAALARLAWKLGDRHLPADVRAKTLRLRRDPTAEQLLTQFGLPFTVIEAPFEPDDAASTGVGHGHHHHAHAGEHAHHHDHSHHDHGHGHGGKRG